MPETEARLAAKALTFAGRQVGRCLRRRPPLIGLVNRTLERDDALFAARLSRCVDDMWDEPAPVRAYEQDFQSHVGGRYVTAWASARVALSAALTALQLPPGSDVLLPGYTCVVVANAVRFVGLSPVYVDIELETFGPSIDSIRERVTPNTRAIITHHLYGLVARDYLDIVDFARDRGFALIDDCAQATGALHRGLPVGALADVAIYSSEQSKIINTIQGGTAVTANDEIAGALRRQWEEALPSGRSFSRALLQNVELAYLESAHPWREFLGPMARRHWGSRRLVSTLPAEERGERPAHYGRRMAAPAAMLGSQQITKMSRNNARRRAAAARWMRWAKGRGYKTPTIVDGSEPVFLRYPVLVPAQMKQDTSWGRDLGVEVGVWFRTQLHPAPGVIDACPNARYAVEHCVNLPTL